MKNVSFRRNGVEFEPTKQELKIVLDDYAKQLGERDKRIADLERQLAEKDERIRKLHLEAQEYYEDAYCNDFQDKAKADFAIGQLEWVRGIMMFHPPADNEIELIKSFLTAIQNKIQELRGQ